MQLSERLRLYRADKEFCRRALGVMLPVAVQQLINSLFNMVDNLMVGSLDPNGLAMSAVSVANKPYTIFTCLLFGLTGGAGLMISQYYGAEEHKTCQGLFSLQVFLSLAISVVFFVLLQLLPRQIMGLFVKDENTILLGLSYLAVVSISYLPTAISNVCVLSLRSIGLNRLPMLVSLGTITANAVCNYILIFGKLGAPAMGVAGAAWGTLIARMLEMLVYLALLGSRRMYFSWNLRAALRLPGRTVRTFFVKASPLVANELLWSVGLNLYFWCYARLDEASLPAISIAEVQYVRLHSGLRHLGGGLRADWHRAGRQPAEGGPGKLQEAAGAGRGHRHGGNASVLPAVGAAAAGLSADAGAAAHSNSDLPHHERAVPPAVHLRLLLLLPAGRRRYPQRHAAGQRLYVGGARARRRADGHFPAGKDFPLGSGADRTVPDVRQGVPGLVDPQKGQMGEKYYRVICA